MIVQTSEAQPLDQEFMTALVDLLMGTTPLGDAAPDAARAARRRMIAAILAGLRPADPVQAMLAAEIIGFHFGIMDCLRLAMLPDTDAAQSIRLRAGAAGLARLRQAAQRSLDARQAPPATQEPDAKRAPPAKPAHHIAPPTEPAAPAPVVAAPPEPEILDGDGNPIPLHRWQDMTMEQRRLAYGYEVEPGTPLNNSAHIPKPS